MPQEFYLDTAIWLDFYEKRGRNGEVALKLIEKIIDENNVILYSDVVLRELKKLGYTQEDADDIFRVAKPSNLRKVHLFDKQIKEASKIAKVRNVPQRDALHAILSRDNYAQLISRDIHFEQLKDITAVKLPEDFI
ncbi:MAG: PIN domain-containing protein [Nanoarchaeota archaeon]|nr:PIN domain-containing protein [Nanoarchaeota archaeon]